MQEILTSGKPRPDPKPEDKPAGTRFWKKKNTKFITRIKPKPKVQNPKAEMIVNENPDSTRNPRKFDSLQH